jgi:antitoxin (DNA-binding transcriptional repressor) of toxin-antitoxin stability system
MKMVTVRELRATSSRLWETLKRDREIVVTSNGKPVALLTPIGEADLVDGIVAVRRARATMAIAAMQQGSVAKGLDRMSSRDIEREIAAARRMRR